MHQESQQSTQNETGLKCIGGLLDSIVTIFMPKDMAYFEEPFAKGNLRSRKRHLAQTRCAALVLAPKDKETRMTEMKSWECWCGTPASTALLWNELPHLQNMAFYINSCSLLGLVGWEAWALFSSAGTTGAA